MLGLKNYFLGRTVKQRLLQQEGMPPDHWTVELFKTTLHHLKLEFDLSKTYSYPPIISKLIVWYYDMDFQGINCLESMLNK